MTQTFVNDRNGRSVTTDLSHEQIATIFGQTAPKDSWLWFWLAEHAEQNRTDRKPEAMTDALAFLSDLFVYAIGSGLKKPMIRLHHKGQRFKIYLSSKGTVCIKTGGLVPIIGVEGWSNEPVGDEYYIGCLLRGKFLPVHDNYNRDRQPNETEREFLSLLQEDPVGFFARASKDMDRCCYCYKALEDERSKEVGYGSACAAHWGLPWGKKGRKEECPTFAECWLRSSGDEKRTIRGLCATVKANPLDQFGWDLLTDALADAGHVRVKKLEAPTRAVNMPRE